MTNKIELDESNVWVLRIEDSLGIGPYVAHRSDDEFQNLMHDLSQGDRHPAPYYDGLVGMVPSDYVFGFRDWEQLKDWFTFEEYQKLQSFGFAHHYYLVPKEDVIYLWHQVMFNKHSAIKKEAAK